MKLDKTILVMDWLDAYAGSEQVVKYLHQVYKFDKLYVLTNIMPSEKIKKIFGDTPVLIKSTRLSLFEGIMFVSTYSLSNLKT